MNTFMKVYTGGESETVLSCNLMLQFLFQKVQVVHTGPRKAQDLSYVTHPSC